MRVFVTGGTGLIGSAVVAGLLNGHAVLALAHSGSSATALETESLGRPGHGTVPNVSAEALCACFHKPFPRRSGEQHRNFRSAYRAPASA